MEIRDYLRIARRRLWILVGVPVLAAGVAAALILLAPQQYTATATVNPPALVGGSSGNQYTGSQAVNQYVSAFQSTATGPVVARLVSKAADVSLGDLNDNLDVAQVGASSGMTVAYTSTNRGQSVPVVTSTINETLANMFGSQVDLATAQVTEAHNDLNKANAAIVAWGKKNAMADPARVYQAQLDQINGLLQQQATLQVTGKAPSAAALAGTIATARAGLAKFGPLLSEFNGLAATRDAAQAGLTQAQNALQAARVQMGASDPAKVAFVGTEQAVDAKSKLASAVLPIAGAGVFLAIALIVILELLRGSGPATSTRSNSSGRRAARDGSGSAAPHRVRQRDESDSAASVPAASRQASASTPAPSEDVLSVP